MEERTKLPSHAAEGGAQADCLTTDVERPLHAAYAQRPVSDRYREVHQTNDVPDRTGYAVVERLI